MSDDVWIGLIILGSMVAILTLLFFLDFVVFLTALACVLVVVLKTAILLGIDEYSYRRRSNELQR